MTSLAEPMVAAPESGPRRPRRRLRLAVAAVVVALLGGGVTWLVYATTYQPWGPGNVGMSEGNGIKSVTDGTRDTSLIVTAPEGHLAWYGMTLEVTGRFDVRVLGQEPLDGPGDVHLRWQVLPRDDMAESPYTATDRPVTVHPGELLTLWILVTRPDCSGGESTYMDSVPLRWSALGVHHTYDATINAGVFDSTPLYLCYPAAALRHIDPGLA